MIEEKMRAWAQLCVENPAIAVISIPFMIVISIGFAIWLWAHGDDKWREMI